MVAVDRVAAARVVPVGLAAVFEHVVNTVLQALEAEGWPLLVAFGRVVEDDVQDDFDARLVQRQNHLLEFEYLAAGLATDRIPAVRREERQRIVAPVVRANRLLTQTVVDREFVDRHQLDRRHPQRLQVGNLLDHPQVGPRVLHSAGPRLGESADVHLIDDRLGKMGPQMPVSIPIELLVDDYAFRRTHDAVVGRQETAGQGLGIGIDQPGLRVETVSLFRFVRSVRLEMVELTRPHAGDEDTPNVAPPVQVRVEVDDFGRLAIGRPTVEQHPHRRGRAAENDELNPTIMYNCTIR